MRGTSMPKLMHGAFLLGFEMDLDIRERLVLMAKVEGKRGAGASRTYAEVEKDSSRCLVGMMTEIHQKLDGIQASARAINCIELGADQLPIGPG
jgi:hypothetical protein